MQPEPSPWILDSNQNILFLKFVGVQQDALTNHHSGYKSKLYKQNSYPLWMHVKKHTPVLSFSHSECYSTFSYKLTNHLKLHFAGVQKFYLFKNLLGFTVFANHQEAHAQFMVKHNIIRKYVNQHFHGLHRFTSPTCPTKSCTYNHYCINIVISKLNRFCRHKRSTIC